ncbi:hypothetical protein [Bradyrhizobium sp. STM 3562]|uniref:hypothetical protein n=1 Tax=Bradyrhizobium sp. STM 3562 TaxID=578924 RepID=UPI00388E97C9
MRSRNDVLSYCRTLGRAKVLVGLNIANEPRQWEWEGRGLRLISTYLDRSEDPVEGPILLRANEGVVVLRQSPA